MKFTEITIIVNSRKTFHIIQIILKNSIKTIKCSLDIPSLIAKKLYERKENNTQNLNISYFDSQRNPSDKNQIQTIHIHVKL